MSTDLASYEALNFTGLQLKQALCTLSLQQSIAEQRDCCDRIEFTLIEICK